MRINGVVIIIFYIAITEVQNSTRIKRQWNNWNWGNVNPRNQPRYDVNPRNQQERDLRTPPPQPAQISNSDNAKPDLCAPFKLDKPNFNVPGRRISEIKCYEYIWEVKYRDEKKNSHKACLAATGLDKIHILVIGGHDSSLGEFPHMGAIGWKGSNDSWVFKCGGSLISPKFILTAAHCSRAPARDTSLADPVPKIVRFGVTDIEDKKTKKYRKDVNIIRIIVHPYYASPKKYFDIALMELEETITFSKYMQPACLWNHFDISRLGTKATVTGWGVTKSTSRTTSPILQVASVDILDSQTCNTLLRPSRLWCGMQDHQICAGVLSGGVDACQGDSGGPLQVQIPLPIETEGSMHYVFGVTSFGAGCARANKPGIYTRVSSFIDWIEGIVWR